MTRWISWENILKAIPVIVGAVATLYQLRTKLPGSRSQLKSDLEILKLLPDEEDPSHKTLKTSIDAKITRMYSGAASRSATEKPGWKKNWVYLVYGISLFLIFGFWTYYLVNRGSWWAILTGFFALAGAGNVMAGFERSSPRGSRPPVTTPNDQGSQPKVPASGRDNVGNLSNTSAPPQGRDSNHL